MQRRQFVRVLQKLHLWDEGKRIGIISAKVAAYWDYVRARENPKNKGKSIIQLSEELFVGDRTLKQAIAFFRE